VLGRNGSNELSDQRSSAADQGSGVTGEIEPVSGTGTAPGSAPP